MKDLIFKISLTFVAVVCVLPIMAQGSPPATPIDGGLSILLAAGGAYGFKKIHDYRKNS